jgi:acyl-CoA thioester hydrolase
MQEQRIRIRWRDMDNYGHVNNAVYLTYLEECRDRWARTVLGDAFDFVIVRVAIDYRRELSLSDEEVVVQCRGLGYGDSSIRTTERIVTTAGELAAESESVIVKHDAEGRRALALTGGEKALLDEAIAADAAT